MPTSNLTARKEGFRYFMEKEIYEQGSVVASVLAGRIQNEHIDIEELPVE